MPNMVDPSGMIGETPATWNVCYAQQSTIQEAWNCVANSPISTFYEGDLWVCDGQGCQEWLDEAHCILNEGSPGFPPTDAMKETAIGLLFNQRARYFGNRISFILDGELGVGFMRTWMLMPSAALGTLYAPDHPSLDFKQYVSLLSHEYYHTAQATGITGEIRGSIRLEVEAYLFQAMVKYGLGIQPSPWEIELATRFNTIPISPYTDYCDLCWARMKLRERFGPETIYDSFLLIESPIPVTTAVCSQYNCPDQ